MFGRFNDEGAQAVHGATNLNPSLRPPEGAGIDEQRFANDRTDRIFCTANLKLALRYPDVALAFLTGGRLNAYRKAISVVLTQMARLPCADLEVEVKADLAARHISFSKSLRPFEALNRSTQLALGVLLYKIVRVLRPKNVVETGVCLGNSSCFILGALHANGSGRLHSIDLGLPCFEYGPIRQMDSRHGKDVGWLIPRQFRGTWALCIGDSRDKLLPLLDSLAGVDLFFHDSEHSYDLMTYEYRTAWPHIRPGGMIVSDDVQSNNAFREFAAATDSEARILDGEVGVIRKKPADLLADAADHHPREPSEPKKELLQIG
jgi:predicted O-methyltransferase YrrM